MALDLGIEDPKSLYRRGTVTETLAYIDERIDMVVLGRHTEKLGEHLGSRLEKVIRSISHPLLITTETFTPPQKVMIACDGSPRSRRMLDVMIQSDLLKELPCHLVMVRPKQGEGEKQLEGARAALQGASYNVEAHLVVGDVETRLADFIAANGIDFLVMGGYGHSPLQRLLRGSTTTAIIRDIAVPVLLVR